MRKQEKQILLDVSKIEKKQALLLQNAKTPQQQFLHSYCQRYLVGKKMLHKNIEQSIEYLQGSFSQKALIDQYLCFVLQSKIELDPSDFNIVKFLIEWTDKYPTLKGKESIPLIQTVFPENSLLQSTENIISYVDFIASDIIKLIKRKDSSEDGKQKYNYSRLAPEEILSFLNVILPKILFNILLPNEVLPIQLKKQEIQSFECLYKISSLQYYLNRKQKYSTLVRILLKGLLDAQLNSHQQRALMQLVFRYFYAYHNNKNQQTTEIFVQAFNKLSESTRYAMADEFILFFRIIRKLGKGRFANFIADKSSWVRQITGKINEKSQVGYQKQSVNPSNLLQMCDTMVIQNRKKAVRYFEVLEDYSLFYFKIDVVALDITIRLYYLGDIDSEKSVQTLLIQQQKKSGEFKNNVMAAKRGLYLFQFDNSYSWINSKTVKYDNVILSPMQIISVDSFIWIPAFYNNIATSEVTADKLVIISKQQPKKKIQQYEGTAKITKNGLFFNLKINRQNQVYEFQSENQDRFVQKFNELISTLPNLKWTINDEPLPENEDIVSAFGESKKAPKKEIQKITPPKPAISYEDYNEQDASASIVKE